MRHNHPSLVLTIMGGLPLAIAGDPAAFVLLVMASPLIIIMIFSCAGASCTAAETSRTRSTSAVTLGVEMDSSRTRPSSARKQAFVSS